MIFRSFLENAMGSYAKVKVLRYLLAESSHASGSEIARLLGLSPMTVNRVMRAFNGIGLVTQSRIGGVIMWKLNKNSWSFKALSPIHKVKTNPFNDLQSSLQFHAYPYVKGAYLFGSVANKKETSSSDIDLLLVVENKSDIKREGLRKHITKLTSICVRDFGNRLSVYFLSMGETKKSKLFENAKVGVKLK